MNKEGIYHFISKQKTSLISSVDKDGFPWTRALIAPRLIEGNNLYFSTYVTSNKVKHFQNNSKACLYFYEKSKPRWQGMMLKGNMEVLFDQKTKDKFWKDSDKMFFRNGKTDQNYCILKFTAIEAEYFISFRTEKILL